MPRECVICNEADSEESPLIELPCFKHWVCREGCIASYFENATSTESLYPPQCCREPIPLDRYDKFVPDDVKAAFLVKEQGEYTILPKYRVYCANASCGKFLHPSGHIHDTDGNITYAVCDGDDCFQATCCSCKTLLADGTEGHICKTSDHDQKFKETVNERGFKECFVCGAVVELAEACNHITCDCGNNFCYICGKEWTGDHGCPQYGPAHYDEEGFNVRGYHRDTGLNREGRTFQEQMRIDRGEGNGQDSDGDDEEDDEEDDDNGANGDELEDVLWQQILSHADPARRAMLESVDPDEREDALMQLQIELIDQGVVLDFQGPLALQQPQGDGDNEDELNDVDEEGEVDAQEDAQEDGAQEQGHQEDGVREVEAENVEVIQGIDPSMGDEELMFHFEEDIPTTEAAPQVPSDNSGNPGMAGAWVDSDAPSPDDIAPGTTSTIESSATPPDDPAELSD
ncbi:hypothetical protein P171DRAFT_238268 [Karstenula rhodostoma CBS 690.94]|uniref:RBR-type E3 ubiquitin transferase n=1 Tax=Karstenula rhodostoma CBS 690.94 TaxID=1392251 RepID=A0A9P4UF02_9PLEO|nr:hypothetical protein P171DRAFT_238268 [Karstenula rhodostoma CBS 690.94]